MVAKGEGFRGGVKQEVGLSRWKLLYIEWINTKASLYDTENHIQYPVICRNGEEYFFLRIFLTVYIYIMCTYIDICYI